MTKALHTCASATSISRSSAAASALAFAARRSCARRMNGSAKSPLLGASPSASPPPAA